MAAGKPIATVALGIAAVLCAGAALYWWLGVERTEVYTDDGSIKASADVVAPRDVLWRPPEPLAAVNSALAEGTPRVSPAGDALYLTRTSADGGSDILVSRRAGRAWTEPEPVDALNSPDNEQGAIVSPDGAWLYFASDRPGGHGGYDLWRAPRDGDGWGTPEVLGETVNSPANELHAAPDTDGSLLFASDRAHSDGPESGFDLYRARLESEQPAALLSALNSPADDVGIAVSPSGDFVYLSSDRPGGAGGFDLYRARRTAEGFGPLESLGAPINTAANELEPSLAMEGFALLYASDAEGTLGATDVLRSVSREVYLARGSRFAGLLGDLLGLLPWVLALLALILLLAMLRRVHAGGAWEGRLSTLGLMARCVLASVLLHALLLALLAYWQVQLAPGSPLGDDGGTRVALIPGGGAESIGAQVRGGFTEAEVTRAETERVSPEASANSARPIETNQLQAAADASRADRAMPMQADRSEAQVAERGSSTAIAASAEVAPLEASAPLGMPDAVSRAVAGEADRAIARGPWGTATIEAPAGSTGGARAAGTAEIAASAGPGAAGQSMTVRAGGSDAAASADDAVVPTASTAIEAGDTGVPALGVPSGSGRAVVAEPAVAGPARAAARSDGAGPAVAVRVGPADEAVEPLAWPNLVSKDPSVSFGVQTNEASPVDDGALASSSGPTLKPVTAVASAALGLPDANAGADGARVETESVRRAARAKAGGGGTPPSVSLASGTPTAPTTIEPSRPAGSGQGSIAFETAAAGAQSNELSTPGIETPQIDAADTLGSLALAPFAAPGGSEGATVADEQRRAIDRARDGRPDGAPDAVMRAASASSEITPSVTRSAARPDPVAVERATPDAEAPGEDPLAVAAGDLPPALGFDELGTLSVPTPSDERRTRSAASDESNVELERARNLAGADPIVSGTPQGADAAEIHPSVAHAADSAFGFGAPGRAARIADDAPAPLGAPESPGLEPAAFIAIALPVPAAPLRLTGVVLDDGTGEPIPGARVRLDLIESDGIELTTNGVGAFEMGLDDVPDNIALAAFADGYVPGALNIAEDDLEDDGAYAEFRLVPYNPFEIAMEDEPRVHHLGNDEYSGRINSQFQRATEGREIRFEFELGPEQLPPNVRRAEIVLLAKGVQLPNPVGVNGRRLATTMQESPGDGSFGEQRIPVPLSYLEAGPNWIAFRSIRQPGTDIDDFEFVNVRLVFEPRETAAPF
ncbi:MAG: hypothetical protein RIB32_01035 [Phycisphaerales bacterium]